MKLPSPCWNLRKRADRFKAQDIEQFALQAGVIASQIVWHSRGAADLGIISSQEYREELSKGNKLLTHVHNVGDETIFLRSGYAAHIHQAAPPKDALAYPLPSKWGLCENITVRDVR